MGSFSGIVHFFVKVFYHIYLKRFDKTGDSTKQEESARERALCQLTECF